MSRLSPTFMDLCIQGEAFISEVDDYVESWHESEDDGQTLADFLGLSEAEYRIWVERPFSLKLIVYSKKHGVSVDRLLRFSEGQAMAARASSPEEVDTLLNWLKQTKRIPR